MSDTALDQLRRYSGAIDAATMGSFGRTGALEEPVTGALGVPGPKGDPEYLDKLGQLYTRTANGVRQVQDGIQKVAGSQLPEYWRGEAADGATRSAGETAEQVGLMAQRMASGAKQLHGLALGLRIHRENYERARRAMAQIPPRLEEISMWDGEDNEPAFQAAKSDAQAAIKEMIKNFEYAKMAGTQANDGFTEKVAGAR
ncbi:hypothetical protein D5S17_12385 [Pseudonocardiaceae bacterium YIM PH 21723]|nr:hypothetical protein D5S17_12385 [Pseudonocardiaceae bacterium YIM PH 21723]